MYGGMASGSSMVVGIFDDTFQAERALDELRQMGFRGDQIDFEMSEGAVAVGDESGIQSQRTSQAVVRVRAEGRRQEVVDVLHRLGAYDVRGGETATAGGHLPGNPGDVGSPGTGSVTEGATGSAYDANRDSDTIDENSPRRVTQGETYSVAMDDTGKVRTGASEGIPVSESRRGARADESPGGERWDDLMSYYRTRWQQTPGSAGRRWEDYEPAYRYGWERANTPEHRGRSWSDVEPEMRSGWESRHHQGTWDRIVDSVRDAWEHVTGQDRHDADRAA